MSDQEFPTSKVFHLLDVKDAATMCGISTKLFLVALRKGQLGGTEELTIGGSTMVRAKSLVDFLDGAYAAQKFVASPSEMDLFVDEER